ncbi:MAG: ABC transporter ATP-binding protein [Anaerolineales bacterium]|jgi:branched-chain amino acid transport system ATP-binding protein
MLTLKDLTSGYGHIRALQEISLDVQEGEIVTIIGPNGAGKTTLLNTISGVVRASGGRIMFGERNLTHLPPHKIVQMGISQVPERRQVFDTMSVRDNLILGAYHRARREGTESLNRSIGQVVEMFPVLEDRLEDPAETLSGGMQQMLAIGRGLMAQPKLLLLDEPSLGLAPLLVQEIFRTIADLRLQGTTVLLVEQNARAALRVADRGYVLETGRVTMSGTATELALDEGIQRAYLGHVN